MKQIAKIVLELGPLVIYLVAFNYYQEVDKYQAIYIATAIFMGAITISLVLSWLILKKLATMPLVTCAFVLVFGGLTIYFQDDLFIKMKPTIINLLFAAILFGGLYYRKLLLKFVLEESFKLEDEGWRILTIRWASFFVFLAIVNEASWRGADLYYLSDPNLSGDALQNAKNEATEIWLKFKPYVLFPMTMIFAMAQIGIIQKYMIEPENTNEAEAET